MPKAATKPNRVASRRSPPNRLAAVKTAKPASVVPSPNYRAMHAYASWLFMERRILCGELWPHMGSSAERYDYADNAGYHWHFRGTGSWKDLPQPSSRAAAVLDKVGVDWRKWDDDYGLNHSDNGDRPGYPPGWPHVDGELRQASASFGITTLALKGLIDSKKTDTDDYRRMSEEFSRCLDVLKSVKARSSEGMWAKAAAVRNHSDPEIIAAIAKSLASDILERPEVMCVPSVAGAIS
jgi:hypothetical protein